MRRVSLHEASFEYDAEDPEGFRAGGINVGRQLEAHEQAVKWFEVPPGESLCPYHYEYVEEWLLVLEGEVVIRIPEGEETVGAGTVVCFPAGAEGAHKVSNRGERAARVLMWSSSREPAVAVYPDSDKIGVWPGDERDTVMLRRENGSVPNFDGEL